LPLKAKWSTPAEIEPSKQPDPDIEILRGWNLTGCQRPSRPALHFTDRETEVQLLALFKQQEGGRQALSAPSPDGGGWSSD
jgi:hypothetical protein